MEEIKQLFETLIQFASAEDLSILKVFVPEKGALLFDEAQETVVPAECNGHYRAWYR